MTDFAKTLELLYGIVVPPFETAASMFAEAMADIYSDCPWDQCGGLVNRYAGCEDAFRVALENGSWTPIYSDVFGLMTNAVLVAIPFRHEAVWVELEAPHGVWYHTDGGWGWCYAEGWHQPRSRLVGNDASGSRFFDRLRRSRWLHYLLPDASNVRRDDARWAQFSRAERAALASQNVRRALETWPEDLEVPTEDLLRDQWARADRTGCAEALISLWGAFFLDAPGLLIELLDATEGHPSTAVASARKLVHAAQWSRCSDDLLALLRAHRAAFLGR